MPQIFLCNQLPLVKAVRCLLPSIRSKQVFWQLTALTSIGVRPVRLIPLPCQLLKRQYLGSERVLRLRFGILQGSGTKRTGRTLSDSNAAEFQICGAKPCVPLFTEGI